MISKNDSIAKEPSFSGQLPKVISPFKNYWGYNLTWKSFGNPLLFFSGFTPWFYATVALLWVSQNGKTKQQYKLQTTCDLLPAVVLNQGRATYLNKKI